MTVSRQSLKVRGDLATEAMNRKLFVHWCQQSGLPVPETEYRFAAPDRQWRFDFAFVENGVALEVEGGLWVRGAHTRGKHALSDMDKYNCATLRGWRVLRVVPKMLLHQNTLDMVQRALNLTTIDQ